MRFQKFTDGEGQLDCIVNMDAVVAARPSEDGKRMILHTEHMSLSVDRTQFEEAISAKDGRMAELSSLVSRLIQAMDRMTLHFPTSIRMHM